MVRGGAGRTWKLFGLGFDLDQMSRASESPRMKTTPFRSLFLVVGILSLVAATTTPTAHAHDVKGLGIGGNAIVGGGLTGIDVVYWFDPSIALEVIAGTTFVFPDGGDTQVDLGVVAGVLFALIRAADTHLELGARAGFAFDVGPGDDQEAILLDVPLRAEHWLGDQFSFNAQVGVILAINPGDFVSLGIGNTGLYGGAGFTFYLEPSGSSQSAPAPAPAAAPAPAPQTY